MAGYKFYMQKATAAGKTNGSAIDLEATYSGLRYRSCTGLETVGAVKNMETESYAESSVERVWHPSDGGSEVTHETTTVTLNLVFLGDDRRATLESFRTLAYSGRLFYWDTARLKKAYLVMSEEQTVEADTLLGTKYISAGFKFINLWGRTKTCTSSGTVV